MRRLLWLLAAGAVALGQTYHLRSAVAAGAGRRVSSSGYVLQFSLAQSFASGILACSGYLGTIGFWRSAHMGGAVVEREEACGSSPVLQVSPTIVRRALLVAYVLPEESDVSVRMLDRAGTVVGTLVSGRQGPGNYRLQWETGSADRDRLPDGVYFVQMRAAGRTVTRKLVIAR